MDDSFRDLLEQFHSCADSSSAIMEIESLKLGGPEAEEEQHDPLDETPSWNDGPIFSHTEGTSLG